MKNILEDKKNKTNDDVWIPTACSSCVDGPCLVRVHRINGVAINIEGNATKTEFKELTKGKGHICPKAFGLLQKLYNPHRVKGPMKRTNPKKGHDENPGWIEISWDEALETVGQRLKEIREKDPRRLSYGYGTALPRLSSGIWFNFFEAWGPAQVLTSGTSIRCDMAEHNYANTIHGAFQCEPDVSLCKYLLLFGTNTSASGGVPEGTRMADARIRGLKTVAIDPVLTVTGAKADEWLPIRPGSDSAFMLVLIHVILHELCFYDSEFLKNMTNSPYLIGPDGYFVRDQATEKVLVWDNINGQPKAYDDDSVGDFALEGVYSVNGVECRPAHQMLKDHVKQYTPEWAESVTDIPAGTTRRIAKEFVENAMIGSTITIGGVELPYRPVATKIGRGITGAMRSYQCILANHILACLVGCLEVPGGHQGGRAHHWDKNLGIIPGPDGMPEPVKFPFTWPPVSYGGTETLVPYARVYGRLTHLAWRNLVDPPKNFPLPPLPEALILGRCNPLLSVGEPEIICEALKKMPFFVYFAYVENEMTQFADIVLPEHIEFERYEASTFVRSALGEKLSGITLRQPVVEPVCNTMDISDVLIEIAERVGMLKELNMAINGDLSPPNIRNPKAIGIVLNNSNKLELDKKYEWIEIVERHCKSLTNDADDLESLKTKGGIYRKIGVEEQYDVHMRMKAEKLRYYIPYAEHVKKTGEELSENLTRLGIDWWPTDEYVPLPTYFPSVVEQHTGEYQFYMTTMRAMQFSTALVSDMPWLIELSKHVFGLESVLMNRVAGESLGIEDGDEIYVESEVGKVKSKVKLCEGIRPDTLAISGQFGNWATPIAKDTGRVSLTPLMPIRADRTDHMISNMQGHCTKVKVYKA